MKDWQQRNPLMSKWNTGYKRAGEAGCILSKQRQIRQCAMSRGLETCGGFGEMERCEKLGAITEHNADALKRLKTGI